MLAVLIALAASISWGLVAGTPIVGAASPSPLIPVAVTVAIIRHQLLDIRLVVSRALSWVLLSLAVAGRLRRARRGAGPAGRRAAGPVGRR